MQRFTPPVLLLLSAALVMLIGYRSLEKTVSAARSDAQIAGDIQAKLSSEPAFSRAGSPNVHVAVTNGVATLSGQVPDNQARLMASTDASKVDGVKEVVNDLTLANAKNQSQNQNTSVCTPPHRVHHRARAKTEHAPELASDFVPPAPTPAPEPAPVAPPPAPVYPPCACVPMVVLPATVMVPAPPVVYAFGFPPAVGIGIYARPGWVRPYPYARPFAYGRPAGRPFVR